MARRLVEAGVRFVQIFPPVKPQFQPWDAHTNVKTENEAICGKTDLPSAALIKDLNARGLLDSTIMLWSGEFGRLPVSQNGKAATIIATPSASSSPAGQLRSCPRRHRRSRLSLGRKRVSVRLYATILHQRAWTTTVRLPPPRPRRNADRCGGDQGGWCRSCWQAVGIRCARLCAKFRLARFGFQFRHVGGTRIIHKACLAMML